jgi:hypothetical protein
MVATLARHDYTKHGRADTGSRPRHQASVNKSTVNKSLVNIAQFHSACEDCNEDHHAF